MAQKYKIDTVRFSDNAYSKEIDRYFLGIYDSYNEAVDAFEHFLIGAGFKHVEQRMRSLRKKGKEKTLLSHMSVTDNLHGHLGPGGYDLQKTEVE